MQIVVQIDGSCFLLRDTKRVGGRLVEGYVVNGGYTMDLTHRITQWELLVPPSREGYDYNTIINWALAQWDGSEGYDNPKPTGGQKMKRVLKVQNYGYILVEDPIVLINNKYKAASMLYKVDINAGPNAVGGTHGGFILNLSDMTVLWDKTVPIAMNNMPYLTLINWARSSNPEALPSTKGTLGFRPPLDTDPPRKALPVSTTYTYPPVHVEPEGPFRFRKGKVSQSGEFAFL